MNSVDAAVKRIAVVTHLSEWSGAPAAAVRFATLLAGTPGYEVCVVVPSEGPAARRARQAGLDVQVVPQPETGIGGGVFSKIGLGWQKLRAVFRLASFLRGRQMDGVWIHGMANVWLGWGAWLARVPVLWHGHELEVPGSGLGARFRVWSIGRIARAVVFAGESSRQKWMGLGWLKPFQDRGVVPNPLPSGLWRRLASAEPRRPFPPGAGDLPVVLSSGLFIRKAPDRLLRGVAVWGRPVRVVIIGEGRGGAAEEEFSRDLDRLIESLPPGVVVERPGVVEEVGPWLARAHVFASLGRSEVAPLLLVEAMALGVPVIVSAAGEQAALLGGGERGLVVEDAGDPTQVAAALEETLSDSAGQVAIRAQKARAHALGMHDPEGATQQIQRILDGILNR